MASNNNGTASASSANIHRKGHIMTFGKQGRRPLPSDPWEAAIGTTSGGGELVEEDERSKEGRAGKKF